MANKKESTRPEVEKAKPEEKLSDNDLEAVTGGVEKKRKLLSGRLS